MLKTEEILAAKADLVEGIVPVEQLPPGGSGDMLRSTYDADLDGKIAEAQLSLNYASHSNATDHAQNADTDLDATFEASLKNTDNHTSGSTNKVYTATEQTKLAGIASGAQIGDTIAPATNTANYLPQWNGDNSKLLKDGLAVPAGGLAGLTALGLKAPIDAPTFTGVPTAPTATDGTDSTQLATLAYVMRRFRSTIGVADLAIANTETMVCQIVFAANELVAGATFMFRAYATRANTTSAQAVARIRVGTTLLSGNIAAVVTSVASTLAVGCIIEGMVTIRVAGSGGTVLGSIGLETHLAAVTISKNIVPTTTAVAVNTQTANQIIGLTFISGSASVTWTFRNACIWRIN